MKKYLIFLLPLYIFADAKGEIDEINKLLEEKHTHKVEFINKNTQRLLTLEIEEIILIKKLIIFKEGLIKMNTKYRYQNQYEDIFSEPNKI